MYQVLDSQLATYTFMTLYGVQDELKKPNLPQDKPQRSKTNHQGCAQYI